MEPEIIYEDDLGTAKKPKYWIWVLLIIAAAVVVLNWPAQDIAVTVNGQDIYQSDIDQKYDQLPDMYKTFITKEEILNQTIDEVLLIQEAENIGIEVTDEEVESALDYAIMASQMNQEQFEQYLDENGFTEKQVKEQIRNKLVIEKLVSQTVDFNISNEDIEAYYNNNLEQFKTLEQRNISHILICYKGAASCEDNRTKEGAEFIAQELRKSKEDFNELARKYSDGPSSVNGGNLGLIDENTQFVPEFLEAALKLKQGQISEVVETDYGFHIIKCHEVIPEKTLTLEETSDSIEQTLAQEKTSFAIQMLIKELRKKSEIINH